jgi:hypothetical protein
VKTAEIWGDRYQYTAFNDENVKQIIDRKSAKLASTEKVDSNLIDAGSWKPFDGLRMYDVLFPHIAQGFRGKNFHVITYHVRS